MKRTGKLYNVLCYPENLRLAFYKAKKGKEARPDVVEFSKNVSANLETLRQQLLKEDVIVGNYRYFTIRDPKTRTICAAPFIERVLHHAIMNVCDPVFERYQIFDSYATRRGKGTFSAIKRACKFAEQYHWFLKMDVKKYFDTIDHDVLKLLLKRLFKDRRVLRLFDRIIDSYHTAPGKGVPIGNLTSQYFANHYLAVVDHFIKERLRVRGYLRYMDDMVLLGSSKEVLLIHKSAINKFLRQQLKLELKPECLNRTSHGIPFLGFRLFPDKALLRSGTRKRYKSKLKGLYKLYSHGMMDQQAFGFSAQCLAAHISHAHSRGFRISVLHDLG